MTEGTELIDEPPGSPRGAEKRSVRRDLVEAQILEHAITLFAERGFAGTNLQDIATATGLTRPALYHYVSSKEDLLARLVRQATDDVADALVQIAEDGAETATERLRNMVHGMTMRQLSDPARFRLLIKSEAELPDELAAAYTNGRRRVLQSFVDVISEGMSSDEFRQTDARTAALGIIGMCNWVAWWHRPGDSRLEGEIAHQYASFAVAGLAQPQRRAADGAAPVEHAMALLREDLTRLERAVTSRPSQD